MSSVKSYPKATFGTNSGSLFDAVYSFYGSLSEPLLPDSFASDLLDTVPSVRGESEEDEEDDDEDFSSAFCN